MATAPPLAVDRLIGLSHANKNLVKRMEQGELPPRMSVDDVDSNLESICHILSRLLDRDIFPWLEKRKNPTQRERVRAATIVADRLCSATSNPIVRNAQERRQLRTIADFLDNRDYRKQAYPPGRPITEMEPGTYAFRMNLLAGKALRVNIPIDAVIQPKKRTGRGFPRAH